MKTLFAGWALFTLVSAQTLIADTIVSVHGDPISTGSDNLYIDEKLTTSWTSSVSYVDVDIAVKLVVNSVFPTQNVTAYLTSKIGPGTTVADEVAPSFTFDALPGPFPFQPTVEVFQNLTLTPGTYYLTLSSDAPTFNTSVTWSVASHGLVTEAGPGVTQNPDLTSFGNAQDSFAPGSVFSPLGPPLFPEPLEFSVTGTPVASTVPEPSGLSLSAIGAALALVLIGRARHRRRAGE